MKAEQANNGFEGEDERVGSFDDAVAADALPVCPKCLAVCHPLQYYCGNCDCTEAINPLTPYIGFVNIRFNYGIFLTMWCNIWYDEDTSTIARLFYLLMIVLFVPVFLIAGVPLMLVFEIAWPKLRKTVIIALCLLGIVLLILLMWCEFSSGLVLRAGAFEGGMVGVRVLEKAVSLAISGP